MTSNQHESLSIAVQVMEKPMRLDQFLAQSFNKYSRTFFQELIQGGHVLLNGVPANKSSIFLQPGDSIVVDIPPPPVLAPASEEHVNALSVVLIHESEHFLVVSKPAGLVVHRPHTGHGSTTLVDWLLLHYGQIASVGQTDRPGIVHRLDKDTSGLLLIARTHEGYDKLIQLFKDRAIRKTYYAIVEGRTPTAGTIDFKIERHPTQPTKMTYYLHAGREATTHYQVKQYFKNHTWLELQPITGRTHQIRVHCAALGHPVLGDTLYGTSSSLIDRQALHAYRLAFELNGQSYEFHSEVPADFQMALDRLS